MRGGADGARGRVEGPQPGLQDALRLRRGRRQQVRAPRARPIFLAAADRPASSWRRYHARLARRAGSLSCSTRDLVFHFRLLRGSSCLHLPWDMFVKGFGD